MHHQPTGGQRLPRTCWQEVFRGRRDKTQRGAGRCSSSHQASMKEAPHSLHQLHLDSRSLHENGMRTRACRPAVREQCAPLPRYQLQCLIACQAGTDSHASPARGRPQAPPSFRHSQLHDHLHHDEAHKGLGQSTHVGRAHPTTLARMPHMVKPLAKPCAA